MTRGALVAIAVLSVAGPAPGQPIYKWVDEKGVTQYATTAPPGAKAQKIEPPPSSSSAAPPQKTWQEKEMELRVRQVERAEAQRKQEIADGEAARRRAMCVSAQNNLKILQEQQRIFRLDEKGERQYLDDAQRAEAVRKALAFIEQQCSR